MGKVGCCRAMDGQFVRHRHGAHQYADSDPMLVEEPRPRKGDEIDFDWAVQPLCGKNIGLAVLRDFVDPTRSYHRLDVAAVDPQ